MIVARVRIGVPIAPNATGAVLAIERETGGVKRREAQTVEQSGGNRDRCAETGRPLDERTERERDEQRLDAPIGGEPRD